MRTFITLSRQFRSAKYLLKCISTCNWDDIKSWMIDCEPSGIWLMRVFIIFVHVPYSLRSVGSIYGDQPGSWWPIRNLYSIAGLQFDDGRKATTGSNRTGVWWITSALALEFIYCEGEFGETRWTLAIINCNVIIEILWCPFCPDHY